jgi:hypothetical protein
MRYERRLWDGFLDFIRARHPLTEFCAMVPLEISVLTADELLLVTLRFGVGTSRDALESCMFQIVDTLARLECVGDKELQDLLWERRRLSSTESCVTLRRRFADPDLPLKLDAALRRLTNNPAQAVVH